MTAVNNSELQEALGRNEKAQAEFRWALSPGTHRSKIILPVSRNYENSARQLIVENHYRAMRTNQTLEFSLRMTAKYQFDNPRALMTVQEVFTALEGYVDSRCAACILPCVV